MACLTAKKSRGRCLIYQYIPTTASQIVVFLKGNFSSLPLQFLLHKLNLAIILFHNNLENKKVTAGDGAIL